MTETEEQMVEIPLNERYVYMEKTIKALEVGLKTGKNLILYGPGGHGKSEITEDFFYSLGIEPYVITMGTGLTTERLFGGFNIPIYNKDGKLEYLVENSFMNHEFVIMEEMLDAPDYILEQLKDILSSGYFRNGTQVFKIKTRFIVACTNKTRDEFSKNSSLKALMERFPLELNVVWDNYNETTYTKLLESRFGKSKVDPIIPFILQEYVKHQMIISPRIALDSYVIFENCGPDSLTLIADFAKKPGIIKDAVKKFESTIEFKKMGVEIEDIATSLKNNDISTKEQRSAFREDYRLLNKKYDALKKLIVNDDLISLHKNMVNSVVQIIRDYSSKFDSAEEKVAKPKKTTASKQAVLEEDKVF